MCVFACVCVCVYGCVFVWVVCACECLCVPEISASKKCQIPTVSILECLHIIYLLCRELVCRFFGRTHTHVHDKAIVDKVQEMHILTNRPPQM